MLQIISVCQVIKVSTGKRNKDSAFCKTGTPPDQSSAIAVRKGASGVELSDMACRNYVLQLTSSARLLTTSRKLLLNNTHIARRNFTKSLRMDVVISQPAPDKIHVLPHVQYVTSDHLTPQNAAPSPLDKFRTWFKEVIEGGIAKEPEAMSLLCRRGALRTHSPP